MTSDDQFKRACEDVINTLLRHSQDAGETLVIIGAVIGALARSTRDPVATARAMIVGLEAWIRMYQAESATRVV